MPHVMILLGALLEEARVPRVDGIPTVVFLTVFKRHGEIGLTMEQRAELTKIAAIKRETVATEDVPNCFVISNRR
jgi:hypothetical protein